MSIDSIRATNTECQRRANHCRLDGFVVDGLNKRCRDYIFLICAKRLQEMRDRRWPERGISGLDIGQRRTFNMLLN